MKRKMNRQQIIDKLNVIAFSSYEYSETAREAISLLIEDENALEKQIPKKPILDTIFPSGVKWFRCPVCNHNNVENTDSYCHNCGQALEWGEESDVNC